MKVSGFRFQVSGLILLSLAAWLSADAQAVEVAGVGVHGFADTRAGVRTQSDPVQQDDPLGEMRLQLDAQKYTDTATFQARADFLYDWAGNDFDVDLEKGDGWFDLREANILFSPLSFVDAKVGRQILTWGTGDLLFINDLFPKDWVSFLSGRDEEYLKAPSDAFFVSFFPGWVNIDLAYTPRFDADRFVSGERLSFFHPSGGTVHADRPDDWFSDDEIAARVSRNVQGYELAAYGYRGYWKSPAGMDPATGKATFPRLQTFGASVRGQAAGGIGNMEVGFYDSLDDRAGDDPFVRNSEVRFLAGYQRELARDLTAGLQYYLEHMLDHNDYQQTLPAGQPTADEDRHVLTLRLTQQLMNQNLTLSVFTFYSPSDRDAYLRPIVSYKASDAWLLTAGANVFLGDQNHTFFGQFEDNTNVYAGARWSF